MNGNSEDQQSVCEVCGHDFDDHLLKGHGNPPTEGWMECPVENCDCYRTWTWKPPAAA